MKHDPAQPGTTPSEREVFRYTSPDGRHVRLIAAGLVDESACEMLEGFIGLQRSQLALKDDVDAR